MFDLLTPIFAAAGVIAASVPFVLHMLRRTPSQKMPFSLVRFLKPSLPKMTKRSTIEHWPLMLLRILALILIGLAFARPFQRMVVEGEVDESSTVRVAVLLDASASMRRNGLREQAVQHLRDVVATLDDTDVLSVATFSQSTQTLISASEWRLSEAGGREALIEKAIEAYEPDWMGTHTGAAMLNAADEVSQEETSGPRIQDRRIIVVTDFQRGSELEELQAATWPAAVQVDLKLVRAESPGNAGITLLPEDRDGQPRVRISNSADSATTDFALQPFDRQGNPVGKPIKASVAAGQRRSVVIPVSDDKATAVIAGAELLQDPHPFDNVVDLPMIENPLLKIVHVGAADSNNAAEMKYYLQRAIDGNETEPFELADAMQSDGVVLPIAADVRLIVVTDIVPEGLLPSMRACLDRGGSILIALKSVAVAESVKSLLPAELVTTEAVVKDYAMLGQIEFSSPLFAAFADARFSDFSSIRFWHHRDMRLSAGEGGSQPVWQVVAKFDSGAPAIVEASNSGGGRVIIFASGWHPDDSQWALSTRFAPMITSLVRQSYPRSTGQMLFATGDYIRPEELTGSQDWTLQLPDGSSVTPASLQDLNEKMQTENSLAGIVGSASDTIGLTPSDEIAKSISYQFEVPGRYLLRSSPVAVRTGEIDNQASTSTAANSPVSGGNVVAGAVAGGSEQLTLIVGVPLAESRTDTLPLGQLQALGVDADASDATIDFASGQGAATIAGFDPIAASQLTAGELESRQKLWRWLLLAGLGCLLLETLIAGGIERRQRVESAA